MRTAIELSSGSWMSSDLWWKQFLALATLRRAGTGNGNRDGNL
jgi:hypothetical protein